MSGVSPQLQLTTTAVAIYTASNARGQITAADLTNSTGAARTATVYKVKSGDTTASANTQVATLAISATGPGEGRTQADFLVSHFLENGDSIRALADADSAVVLNVSVALT